VTKDVFIALLTEEGLTHWEAETFWEAQIKHFPENIPLLTAAYVREFAREVYPASKRLRDLQRARGATHRPDL
jgi:hypothetical protein